MTNVIYSTADHSQADCRLRMKYNYSGSLLNYTLTNVGNKILTIVKIYSGPAEPMVKNKKNAFQISKFSLVLLSLWYGFHSSCHGSRTSGDFVL